MKRREFTQMAGFSALSLLLVTPRSLVLAAEAVQDPMDTCFIYDEMALKYGLSLQSIAHHRKTVAIAGDVTRVWYEDLHYLWKEKAVATAGLTRESEFFVLRTLARDYGYKAVYQQRQRASRLLLWRLMPAEGLSRIAPATEVAWG